MDNNIQIVNFGSEKVSSISNSKDDIKNNDDSNTISSIEKKSNLNYNNSFHSEGDCLPRIEFNYIKEDEINLDFLIKSNMRIIQSKSRKNANGTSKYLDVVLELQNFYLKGDHFSINIIKLSEDGKYLSIGCQDGKIIIYRIMDDDYDNYKPIYERDEITTYLSFLEEEPYLELNGHEKDIIDLCWSPFLYNYLLSASLDHFVILWEINSDERRSEIKGKYEHCDMVTCISFSPIDENIFVSGSIDKYIFIWDITDELNKTNTEEIINNENDINNNNENKEKNFTELAKENYHINVTKKINESKLKHVKDVGSQCYYNVRGIITAISFYPTGDKIAVGTNNGEIYVYEYNSKIGELKYIATFNCKNKFGKNSLGKKITGIEFYNKDHAFISTCDSRIRYIMMTDGKLKKKYKGHKIETSKINCVIDHTNDIIISGSENGFCYIWDIRNETLKNNHIEAFKPFNQGIVKCVIVVPENCYCNYFKKVLKLTTKIFIKSIILIATDNGKMEVLLNIDDTIK